MTKVQPQDAPDAYEQAGVSIDRGNALVDAIKPAVKATARKGLMGGIGGFAGLFDLKACGYNDPILVSGTDGVGTKLKIALETGLHDGIGQDLVAMCANDILVQGAEALFFLDYYATAKLDVAVASRVVNGIARACQSINCALVGGETAEMPGLYHDGDYDLAGFVVGAVERANLVTGETIAVGDVIYALPSSGVHSNGFSLVRKIITDSGVKYSDPCPWDKNVTLGEALMVPTKLYGTDVAALLQEHGKAVKGMAHITGGGLTENIPRVIPQGLTMELDYSAWALPPVFQWLRDEGRIDDASLHRTFNCGIGFILAGPADARLTDLVIGKIVSA
jgi:phosphoribosylaminoimidazole synthetase